MADNFIRPGSTFKLLKDICKAKNNGMATDVHLIMTNYAELKIREVFEYACEVATADNKKIVTEEHLTKALEKFGTDINQCKR